MRNDTDKRFREILYSLRRYITFFLMAAFVVSCCMMVFVSQMSEEMGIQLVKEDIQEAAKLTLGMLHADLQV